MIFFCPFGNDLAATWRSHLAYLALEPTWPTWRRGHLAGDFHQTRMLFPYPTWRCGAHLAGGPPGMKHFGQGLIQHPGLKSIDFLGTAKGHGICSWAPGVSDKCFFGGACVFRRMLCRVACDLHCGCLCCCPVIVSPGVGDELRER